MKRKIVGLLASLLIAPACSPSTPSFADEPAPVQVMTLNVHGGTDRKGGGNKGAVSPVNEDVVGLASTRNPTVVTLQELCKGQFTKLKSTLGKLGYSGAFVSIKKSKGCRDQGSGNAVFVKGKIKTTYVWSLPWGKNPVGTTGRQKRSLLCVRPEAQNYRACVVHLGPHDPDNGLQAAAVASKVSRWRSRVILAGDFNMRPAAVAAAFPGFAAAGSRIDHVLSTTTVTAGATVPVSHSDHPAQFGEVK